MYVKYPTNQITFYYTRSSLFNNVSLRTHYRASRIKDEKGETKVDEYAMSEDESDAFDVFAQDAINDAFQILLKMTTGVTGAIVINGTVHTGAATESNGTYGMKIVDEDAYNDNNLTTVDDGLKKYIEAHIMVSWYNLIGWTDEEIKWMAKLGDIRRDLINNRLFQLRKKSLT